MSVLGTGYGSDEHARKEYSLVCWLAFTCFFFSTFLALATPQRLRLALHGQTTLNLLYLQCVSLSRCLRPPREFVSLGGFWARTKNAQGLDGCQYQFDVEEQTTLDIINNYL